MSIATETTYPDVTGGDDTDALQRAFVTAAESLQQNPDDTVALGTLVRTAAALDAFQPAYSLLKSLMQKSGNSPDVAFHQGLLFALCGLAEIAENSLIDTIRKGPPAATAFDILAGTFDGRGDGRHAAMFRTLASRMRRAGADLPFRRSPAPLPLETDDAALSGEIFRKFTRPFRDGIKTQTPQMIELTHWEQFFRLERCYWAIGDHLMERRLRRMGLISRLIQGMETPEAVLRELQTPMPASNHGRPGDNRREAPPRVYLVAAVLSPRVRKFATALRLQGTEVWLVTRPQHAFFDHSQQDFDRIVSIERIQDMWTGLDVGPRDIVHAFTNLDDGYYEAIAAFAAWPANTVFDIYDVGDRSVSPIRRMAPDSPAYEKLEFLHKVHRFIIDFAPALCTRAMYAKVLKSRFGPIRGKQKRLYLPDSCWGTTPHAAKLSDTDGQLHVVCGCTFWSELNRNSEWAFIYSLGRKSSELGIHLHLYPIVPEDEDISDYEKLAAEQPTFHLHDALPYDEWLSELGKYDVGLFQLNPLEDSRMGSMPRMANLWGTWANKFADYIDAELYMLLCPKGVSMAFHARRYGVGETANPDAVFSPAFWDHIKKKVFEEGVEFSRARRALSVDAHGPRLIEFYETATGTSLFPRDESISDQPKQTLGNAREQ